MKRQLSSWFLVMLGFVGLVRPQIVSNAPSTSVPVTAVNLAPQSANVGSTPILTTAANGFYRASCYVVETQAATTSSTLPNCQIGWTDADTSTVNPPLVMTQTATGNVVGALGFQAANNLPWFFAKSGTQILYQTNGYVSSGATPMQYTVHIRLEGPF